MPVLGTPYHKPPYGPCGDPGPTAEELFASVLGTLATETIKAFGARRCMFGSNYPVVSFLDDCPDRGECETDRAIELTGQAVGTVR
jgi:predicted TIM-barrel fold metal-dependent hydrolase